MAHFSKSIQPAPHEDVRELMHADNGDRYRNSDYRGVEATLPEGSPFAGQFTNPAYRIESPDEREAIKAPHAFVALANLQNLHDHDEKVATESRIAEIGKPGLNLLKHRKLGILAARLSVIDPNGAMEDSHVRFREANIGALMDNAYAQAASEGVTIHAGDEADGTAPYRETGGMSEDRSPESQEKAKLLAGAFHEVWLRTRIAQMDDGSLNARGEKTPRPKPTEDTAWTRLHGMSTVDIANTGYAKLPEDWQKNNLDAATVIVDLIDKMGGADNIDLNDPATYLACGAAIHDAWLENNPYAKGGVLDVSFDQLPPDEQAKDIDQLAFSLSILGPDTVSPARPLETRVLKTVNNWALARRLSLRSVQGDLIPPESFEYLDQYDALISGKR